MNGHVPHANGQAEVWTGATLPCAAASDFKGRKTEWLWEGYIPVGALTLIDGKKNRGKSTLQTAIAVDVTGGPRLPGKSRRRRVLGCVLWITAEEDPDADVRPRIAAAGGNPELVKFPGFNDRGERALRLDWTIHESLIRGLIDHHKPALVVLEPWSVLNGKRLKSASDDDVRTVLEPLQDVSRERRF